MHPVKDLLKLLYTHAKKDSPVATLSLMGSWAFIAPYLFYHTFKLRPLTRNNGFVMRMVNGNRMYLDLSDNGISRDLLTTPMREPFLTQWFQRNIKEGQVEVDVGANIGYYALQAAKLVGEQGIVYAVEPVPVNFELLSRNVRANRYDNVSLHNLAMGKRNGQAMMNWSGMRNYATVLSDTWRSYGETIKVPIATLDEFLKGKRKPDAIRMDTEGYELNIMLGAKKLLESSHPFKVVMEVHFDLLAGKARNLLDLMKRYGFYVVTTFYEPHPVIQDHKFGFKAMDFFMRHIGIRLGENGLSLDDLYDDRFMRGQVEGLEVIFERR